MKAFLYAAVSLLGVAIGIGARPCFADFDVAGDIQHDLQLCQKKKGKITDVSWDTECFHIACGYGISRLRIGDKIKEVPYGNSYSTKYCMAFSDAEKQAIAKILGQYGVIHYTP